MAGAATPALAVLIDAGVPHEVVKFDHDPRERSFGGEAVRALTTAGAVAPEQIYKTLIIAVPDGLAVAILPALARLSLKAAAAALGVPKASMADQRGAASDRLCAGRRLALRAAHAAADRRRLRRDGLGTDVLQRGPPRLGRRRRTRRPDHGSPTR